MYQGADRPLVCQLCSLYRAGTGNAWLTTGQGPAGVPGITPEKARTLTGLSNKRPDWLAALHTALDATVTACHRWPAELGDEAILVGLLALNGERAAG